MPGSVDQAHWQQTPLNARQIARLLDIFRQVIKACWSTGDMEAAHAIAVSASNLIIVRERSRRQPETMQ